MDTLPHIESLYELIAFGLFVAYQLYMNHCAVKQTLRRKNARDRQYERLKSKDSSLEARLNVLEAKSKESQNDKG